jgi:hypothetical protein
MGRVLVLVGALLALAIGGLGLAVYLARDEDNIAIDNLLSERFTRAVTLAGDPGEGGRGEVDLRRYAPFAWDRVVIVARGTPQAAISRHLGSEFKGVVGFDAGELLLFLDGATVVRFADYRGAGRFAGLPRPFAEVPRERAVFTVRSLTIRVKR